MTKEVTELGTAVYNGPTKFQQLGPDLVYGTWEVYGVNLNDAGSGLFHESTIYVMGGTFAEKGIIQEEGACTWALKNGEKVFGRHKASGKWGGSPTVKFTGKLIGGTGKYAGIQGDFEGDRYNLTSVVKGAPITQSYVKAKIRYRLP